MTLKQYLWNRTNDAIDRAIRLYNACYDNGTYVRASGDDRELGYQLQDTALALCGSPAHAIDWKLVNSDDPYIVRFLALFS